MQKHAAIAAARAIRQHRSANLQGEMELGKTTIALAAIKPFFDQAQQPHFSQIAQEEEADIEVIRQEMEQEILKAKRLFDSKPREVWIISTVRTP